MLLALGVVSVVLGTTIIIFPFAALHLAAIIIGTWLIAAGVTRMAGALTNRSKPRDRQRLAALVGVACILAGLASLRDVHGTLRILAIILAVQWLVGGAVDVFNGVRSHQAERRWLVALGALSCAAGVVFLISPALSLLAFNLMTAVSAIGIGVLDIAAGLRLRTIARQPLNLAT
jgi:uncharacterized membrane protein HdeD (DUF308 family)